MHELLEFFTARTAQLVDELKQFVLFESPSDSKEHVDRFGEHVAALCASCGADVTVYPRDSVGDVRIAVWNGDAPGKPILFLTHLDTVWPVGTLATMPLREEDGLLYGPGAFDMKGGLLIAIEAIRGLRERGELPNRPIWLFLNSDEETGSIHSRDLIHEKAAQAALVLVMEPAAPGDSLKTWRKGFARYTVSVTGRASHAGNAPEAGINAVIEAAQQALYLHSLNDLPNGTSVSVTMIEGGVAINVIPPSAQIKVDVRFLKMSEAERVDRALQSLTPFLPGAGVCVSGSIDRGPMERDDQMVRAFGIAQAAGRALGMEIGEQGSGGGSDGNFTAALGIPTLDGLGADGSGMHAIHEQVIIRSLPRRAALVAKLLCDWPPEGV